MTSNNNTVVVIHHVIHRRMGWVFWAGSLLEDPGLGDGSGQPSSAPWRQTPTGQGSAMILCASGLSHRFCSLDPCKQPFPSDHVNEVALFWNLSPLGSSVTPVTSALHTSSNSSPISTNLGGPLTCPWESGLYPSLNSVETTFCAVYNSPFAFVSFLVRGRSKMRSGRWLLIDLPCSYRKSCFSNWLEIHVLLIFFWSTVVWLILKPGVLGCK